MANVSIFVNRCLPLSSVFVYHQLRALQRYRPRVLACNRVQPSVDMGDVPVTAINNQGMPQERIKEAMFKFSGYSPELRQAAAGSDIMHAHFGPTGWLAMPVAKASNIPLVVTLHGFDVLKREINLKNDGLLQVLYALNRKTLGKRVSKFICVSNYIRRRAIEFGFPEEKCEVHYMGIPLVAQTEPKRANEGGPFKLLAVGRLIPFKGHGKLIEAVKQVQDAGYAVHLDIVGEGPLRPILESHAARDLRSYTFHGAKEHKDVLALMRQADVFCHTSLHQPNGQTEAFGLVVLEAQWQGLPVVAFASGGVPEALDEGKTGLLCPEGEVKDFAQNIIRLLNDKALRAQFSENAPNFVKAHFDNARQTAKLEDIYDQARRLVGAR